jgi:hypothetical protein
MYTVSIGELDFSAMSGNLDGTFQGCDSLKTVDLVTLGTGAQFGNYSFQRCGSLVEIRIAGIITQSVNMSACTKLSVDSMKSIISCLKNFAGTENEYTRTLTFPTARWTALEADSAAPNGGTWKAYVGSLGWNT